jgi:SAM-dependent methyltransferase
LYTPGLQIDYERCRDCGIVFRNPRPGDKARLEAYRDRQPSAEKLQSGWDEPSRRHYRFVLERMRRLGLPGRRILDFGCGAGAFLGVARESGFDVEGLEVGRETAAAAARRTGIRVFDRPLPHPGYPEEPFAAVFSSMVFEHLTDPPQTLKVIQEIVLPQGLVVIEVPNLADIRESLRRGSTLDDAHLFYFDRSSIGRLFRENGLELLRVEEGLRPHRWAARLGVRLPFSLASAWEVATRTLRIRTSLTAYARAPLTSAMRTS